MEKEHVSSRVGQEWLRMSAYFLTAASYNILSVKCIWCFYGWSSIIGKGLNMDSLFFFDVWVAKMMLNMVK